MNPKRILLERVAISSLRAVADDLGISVPYLHDILRDKRAPGPKVLKALGMVKQVSYKKAT